MTTTTTGTNGHPSARRVTLTLDHLLRADSLLRVNARRDLERQRDAWTNLAANPRFPEDERASFARRAAECSADLDAIDDISRALLGIDLEG